MGFKELRIYIGLVGPLKLGFSHSQSHNNASGNSQPYQSSQQICQVDDLSMDNSIVNRITVGVLELLNLLDWNFFL